MSSGSAPAPWMEDIDRQIKGEMTTIREEYRKRLDEEVAAITAQLKNEASSRIRSIAIAVISVILAAFAIFTYAQTQTMNKSFIDFQNGVMALQKEVVASQNIILASHESIEKAERELSEKTGQIDALKAELEQKKSRLQETSMEYEARLKALKQAK